MELVPPEASVYQVSMTGVIARVLATRRATMKLVEPLEIEDWVVQSMPDASPAKWHLAHTTWFFERFVLRALGVAPVHEAYDYLFNSYYESVGSRHPRPRRGMITRPTVADVIAYRQAIDARLADLDGSSKLTPEILAALELGKNHEEQHQELLLTDMKHLLGENPLAPSYVRAQGTPSKRAPHVESPAASPLAWHRFDGGVVSIGVDPASTSFTFDNEQPRHRVFVEPFEIASRLVTCAEYTLFIEDRGYERPELWLSEGWAWVNANSASPARAPMYWDLPKREIFTLHGKRAIRASEPVCHVTYFEADAFARWAGARLPREAEWEVAAESAVARNAPRGAFIEDAVFHPRAAPIASATTPSSPSTSSTPSGITQILGDAWEWTQSAYEPYPGFAPLAGAFGEYNGKFMVSQLILRGGSCATPSDHIRTTYRNFFPPHAAWQFTGIRLARDAKSERQEAT